MSKRGAVIYYGFINYIDIYWIHNPMDVEKYTPMIAPLYKKRLIKFVGVFTIRYWEKEMK